MVIVNFKFLIVYYKLLLLLKTPVFCDDGVKEYCKTSPTTASGSTIKKVKFCSGELIFEDDFNSFNFDTWHHENTFSGGGNREFQWYTNNRSNSFVQNGKLYIRPTLTSDLYGEEFLTSGTVELSGPGPADQCTNTNNKGCKRTGNSSDIINPIRSARITTLKSFNFKFGHVIVRAKLPTGDWLWPAIWLLPKKNVYGPWPASGEIDIVEGRSNKMIMKNGLNIGVKQFDSVLHFGPHLSLNSFPTAHFQTNSKSDEGYDKDFHIFELLWGPNFLKFKLDGKEIGTISAGEGFWHRGVFPNNIENPWKNGEIMAPFDQEFYLIINLAVGGINYFPEADAIYLPEKPWINNSTNATTEFWNDRFNWLPTWNLNDKTNHSSALIIDYVRVYAL